VTNPYLDLLQAQPAGPGAASEAPANPYLASLQSEEDQRQQALAGQLTQAVGVNPDQYNAKRRVAQYLGYPTAAVEALPQLEQQAKVQQTRQTIANAPTLQRKYADADFAKLAHDDAPVLAQIEDFIGKATAYVMGATPSGGMGGALKRGVWDNSVVGTAGAFRMVSEVGAAAVEAVVPGVQAWEASGKLGGNPLRRLAEGFAKIGAAQQASKDAATPDAAGNFAAGVESGFESAGQNAKYLPLAFMGPPGWAAALTGMVVETGGLTYQKDREEGVPLGTATLHAGADMLAEYVGERYFGEVGFLKRLAAGAPASKLMMWELTREVPGEIGTTLWQNFNDWTLTNPSKPVSEFLREQPDAIAQTAIATLVGGTAQAGAGRIAVKSVEAVLNRQMEITSTLQREDALKELMAQAAQSKLAERSPEQLKSFVDEASGGAQVRFDAATLVEVFNQSSVPIQQALPSVNLRELQEMAAMGGEVSIPMGELVAGTRGSGIEQTILEHARLADSTLSAAEAREVQGKLGEDMKAQADRVIAQAQDQAAARASQDAVKENLKAQIVATGRVRDSVADGYATWAASFYTAYGSRMGMSAEEMFKAYPLRVLGAQGAGPQNVVAQSVPASLGRELSPESSNLLGRLLTVARQALPNGGDNQPVVGKPSENGAGLDAQNLPDLAEGNASPVEKSTLSQNPAFLAVFSEMRRAVLDDPKILRAVVGTLPVDVVNDLVGSQSAAEELLSNQSVLQDTPAINADLSVAQAVDATDPVSLLIREAAARAAELAGVPVGAGLKTGENSAATRAGEGDSLSQNRPFNRGPLATFNPQTLEIILSPNANLTSFFHESGHFFLEVLADVASQPGAPAQIVEDMNTFLKWAGVKGDETVGGPDAGGVLNQALPNLASMRERLAANQRMVEERRAKLPEGHQLRAIGERTVARLTAELQAAEQRAAPVLAKLEGTKIVDKAGQPVVVYHGGPSAIGETGKFRRKEGGRAVWFSSAEVAGTYASTTVYPAYINAKNPLVVDAAGATWQGLEFEGERLSTDDLAAIAEERGHDGLVIKNLRDENTDEGGIDPADHFAVFDPKQIVSATSGEVLGQEGGPTPEAPPIQPKRTPLETWNAMTLDQKRPYHERWAESVEQYVMEGRAPSVELQPMMRRFAAWLKSVYGSIKQFLAGRGQVSGQGGESLAQMPAPEGVLTGENGKPLVLYHGSPTRKAGRKFDAAKSGQRTDQGNLGSGVYLTPAEFIARAYANNTGDVEGFYVANGKVLTFVYDENYKANIEALATQLGVDAPAEWGRVGQTNLEWSKQFAEKARAAGYVATGGVNSDGSFAEMVVYDPANLKPVSGKPLAQDPNAPAGPDLQLNDDIRRVMDRMLATDEQIAQANEVAGLMPDENADAEAQERLRKRSIADLKWAVKARDKALAKLRKSAKGIEKSIRADVEAEVEQMPEVLAAAALSEGKAPEVVADAFGYPSVEAMHRAIDAFGSPRDAIDGMTERRMLEEHGDLIDDRAIEAAANEAVHNEARARSLATALRTQREMLNTRADTGETNARGAKVTVNALVEAAKQFGANVVSRTPIRDLKSKAWQHTAAERRASKRWAEATAAGKTADAVKAKQDQMLNHAAAKAALDAETEATKIREFFARVAKGNDEETVKKGRDADIVNAARAVLAEFGVETATTKRADDYLDAVKTNDPETWNAIEPMVREATQNAQPLDALTFDELQGLNEQIHALWHLAKRSRQMEVDGDLMDIDDAADEVYARLEAIGIPDTIPGEVGALTKAEERARWLQFAGALLRRVEQWTEKMDGKFGGPFNRLLFQPVKDAATRYRADHIAYRAKFQALVDQVAPSMTHTLIEAPELGYTFGRGHNGIGHAELLHAILHTGNDSNKRKLLLGRRWATENADGTLDTSKWDAFIRRLANTGVLQQAHFDFAQGVWDLMESTKPLAQKTHRDVFGRYFAEVTANPFVDPFGVPRSGGYVPAQADPTIVTDASLRALTEMENESMAFSFPATSKGFTKSRVEYNRPLKLDLRTLPQHIDKVLLFSHMEPAVRGAAKLLRQKKVSQPLNRIDPAAYEGMLLPWLNRSARQQVETPIVGDGRTAKILSTLRSRAGAALMFANVSNTVQQITGVVSAGVKVAPSQLLRAAVGYVQHPQQMTRAVTEASEFMRVRMDNSVQALDDEVKAILTKPNLYERAQDWTQRHAYFLQQAFDNVLSPIVWTGAYNDALAQGMDERMAIRFADGTVRQTQGALAAEDVSRIETGPAYARMFTQFISYFNMMANTNLTALQQINREMGIPARAARASAIVTLGFLLPIWIAEAIAVGFKGGPGDADGDGDADTLVDWLAAVLGMGTIKGLLAQVPFVGTLANSAVARFNGNPADDKMSLSPAVSMLEAAAGVPSDLYKIAKGEGNARTTVRDVASLLTLATGLPLTAAARPLGYAAGVADDRIAPTGPADAARGALTGVPSPASKVQ